MKTDVLILVLTAAVAVLATGLAVSMFYRKIIDKLKEENIRLKSENSFNENLIDRLKAEFAQIAKEAVISEQNALIAQHGADLKTKMDLFKAEEITPVNKLLSEFKTSIDEYKKAHNSDTAEIKNAVATAEKYAKALTTDQNSKGSFGEEILERVLNYTGLEENIHYSKQLSTDCGKPDFVIHLPEGKQVVIDSKTILKNYINYRQTEEKSFKKEFINDLTECINNLAKRHYENIETLNQPGFILMFIPIEPCVNLIYTDRDFEGIIELAASKNIIITGISSLLVSLKMINRLMVSAVQIRNIKNIIDCGERLYSNLTAHAQGLLNITQIIDKASGMIKKEMNRFTARNKGSIFKEAEILKQCGILKDKNTNGFPDEFLEENYENSEKEKLNG